jgi:hypothetical protein
MCETGGYRFGNCLREWRGEGVTYLPIRGCLAARKLPFIWEPLKPCHHPHSQAWHSNEVTLRRPIRDSEAINAKGRPRLAGSSGAEIRAAMLDGTAYDGGVVSCVFGW